MTNAHYNFDILKSQVNSHLSTVKVEINNETIFSSSSNYNVFPPKMAICNNWWQFKIVCICYTIYSLGLHPYWDVIEPVAATCNGVPAVSKWERLGGGRKEKKNTVIYITSTCSHPCLDIFYTIW